MSAPVSTILLSRRDCCKMTWTYVEWQFFVVANRQQSQSLGSVRTPLATRPLTEMRFFKARLPRSLRWGTPLSRSNTIEDELSKKPSAVSAEGASENWERGIYRRLCQNLLP